VVLCECQIAAALNECVRRFSQFELDASRIGNLPIAKITLQKKSFAEKPVGRS
jgi:hypothetical protein